MKKVFRSAVMLMAAIVLPMGFTACSSSDDSSTDPYKDATYGQNAINSCQDVQNNLTKAKQAIIGANLTEEQTDYLNKCIAGFVDDVVVPTYTELGDAVEEMHTALGTLSETEITQQNVNDACTAFKKARKLWEQSEAFLGGAASTFGIDPHIDTWPLDRNALLRYFNNTPTADIDDESYLGFHALEFILFRDGQPRKVAEFQGYDTYKDFTAISGILELQYAENVIEDLLVHVYELQCSWQDNPDESRLAKVKDADLKFRTPFSNYEKSFGWNIKNYGNSRSTFSDLAGAIEQILSADEGSALAIANEVGNKKIANPFTGGFISYVESPYSYNSITDFQDNIRSIENVWYGGRNGASSNADYSFHGFFAKYYPSLGKAVETSISEAISNIGKMPSPFVKYISIYHNKVFEDTPIEDIPEN